MIDHFRSLILSTVVVIALPLSAAAQSCATGPTAVQILGSGGPELNPERASSSYLLWVDGKAKMLIDMGGGTYFRFAQSRAKTSDLALVAISHLHPDHVSDLPAFLWLSHLARTEPLAIVGPSSGTGVIGPAGNDVAPDLPTFLTRLFDEKTGAFQVLGRTLGGRGNGVRLNLNVVDVMKTEPSQVYEATGLKVTALGIPHANMPTLAYRVETPDGSIVFSSDQNGTNPKFVDFARGANVLIMHLAVPPEATGFLTTLHAVPSTVGRIAQEAGVGRLIISHIGQFDLDAALADLRKSFTGPLTVGADLQCTQLR
jgi:ribonuclease BN (tRNA processing enzyme)